MKNVVRRFQTVRSSSNLTVYLRLTPTQYVVHELDANCWGGADSSPPPPHPLELLCYSLVFLLNYHVKLRDRIGDPSDHADFGLSPIILQKNP